MDPISNSIICRICLQEEPKGMLISPCNCLGSMHYVHQKCINKWQKLKDNNLKCEICKEKYIFKRKFVGIKKLFNRIKKYFIQYPERIAHWIFAIINFLFTINRLRFINLRLFLRLYKPNAKLFFLSILKDINEFIIFCFMFVISIKSFSRIFRPMYPMLFCHKFLSR